MASSIKELGFTGECGYNSLLYPVATQTKTLLTWLVQKLPRSEEEQVEEVLGANAALNKKIVATLTEWRKSPWLLPNSAMGIPPRPLYTSKALVTLDSKDSSVSLAKRSVEDIFKSCSAKAIAAESTILERHSLQVIQDAKFSLSLGDVGELDEYGAPVEHSNESKLLHKKVFAHVMNKAQAKQNKSGGSSSTTGDLQSELLSKSLTDVIQNLAGGEGASSSGSGSNVGTGLERGSRFSHAAEFGKESNHHALLSMTADVAMDSNLTSVGDDTAAAGTDSVAQSKEERALAKKKKDRELADKREAELQALRDAIAAATAAHQAKQRDMDNSRSQIRQVEAEHGAVLLQSETLEKEIVVKRKTLEMLPTAADNIAKLQQICGASAKKLMQLAQEWEQHRVPLLEKYRSAKNTKLSRKARCRQMIEEMRSFKVEMQNMLIDLKNKQEKSRVLEEELKKLPKNINRNLYTVRIMEIISSISKQNKDISKITNDIREIQKTINIFTNTVQRADAVAEDKVYSAANGPNRDAAMLDAYRHLTALRNNFEGLVSIVNRIGQIEKDTRDFETKIDQEASRVSGNNFERISSDLEQIKIENNNLIATIRKLQ